MARSKHGRNLKRAMKDIQRAAHAVSDAARAEVGPDATEINVAHRTNLVVTTNLGEPGTANEASVHQYAPIHQGRPSTSQAQGSTSTQSRGGESVDEA